MDSHAALWSLLNDDRLGPEARSELGSATDAMFSAVTPWELNITAKSGKLQVPPGMAERLEANGFTELSITSAHGERAGMLPLHHRDPFDRLLIAQAQIERLTIVTVDAAFRDYEVDLLDAAL